MVCRLALAVGTGSNTGAVVVASCCRLFDTPADDCSFETDENLVALGNEEGSDRLAN